ncbi:hypothetical protein C8J57DRAFT_1375574, partial [Mycena rebaudengoi]
MAPFFLPVVVWLALFQSCIAAQLASPNWRKPTITASPADRVSVVSAALEKAIGRLSPDGQFADQPYDVAGRLYSQMAEFDLATGQKKYQETLAKNLQLTLSAHSNFSNDLLHYALSYGRASVKAYTAYKDQRFLDFAL